MPENSLEKALFEELREHLRFYKWTKGHTVRELAAYCRVTEQTIFNWLKDKTRPKQAKLRLIEEWLTQRKDLTRQSGSDILPQEP